MGQVREQRLEGLLVFTGAPVQQLVDLARTGLDEVLTHRRFLDPEHATALLDRRATTDRSSAHASGPKALRHWQSTNFTNSLPQDGDGGQAAKIC
jgi:hypothetical protein